jgi:predicted  nucleic acid-binding Zn-ribbon protein
MVHYQHNCRKCGHIWYSTSRRAKCPNCGKDSFIKGHDFARPDLHLKGATRH